MKKEPVGIRAAKIAGLCTIIGALIGAIAIISQTIITRNNSAIEKPKNENVSVETFENSVQNSDNLIIPSVLPENEKFHPQLAYEHNVNAKKILDQTISIHDKDIENLLDKAFKELDKSYAIDNELGETQYFYGVAFFKKGDFFIAKDDFNNAITAYNDSLHYFEKAETSYSHISNTFFDKGKTYTALGDVYQNRDVDKSKDYYQNAINSFNDSLVVKYDYPENIYFAMGNIYYKIEDYQKSKECYTNALTTANDKFKPTKKEIFFNRSNASFQLGMIGFLNNDYEIAIQHYRNSIEDNPENYSAHFELGRTYTYLKLWQDAVDQFDFILEHAPKNFDLITVQTSRNFAYSMLK